MSAIKKLPIDRTLVPALLPAGPFTGHFFGAYQTSLQPYSGPNFGKKCFVFAGQGAAKPGMMRSLFDDYALFRKQFAIADELARHHQHPAPSDYILKPKRIPAEQIVATRALCLLTAQYALYRLLLSRYQRPAIITAHSFGEQTALVAAGIFTFEQLFDIIHYRESCSPAEHEFGYLMVVYADPKSIDQALDASSYHIANLNAPLETVIAVGPDRLKTTRQALSSNGIKSNPLRSVPHPYHSPAMRGLSDSMAAYLERTRPACRPPRVPLYSGVGHKMLTAEHFTPQDAYDIIVKLSHTPIDFIQQIETLHELGFMHYVEIGPRTVCTTFVRDILPGANVISRYAGDYLEPRKKSELQVSLDRKSRSFLGVINKVIGKVTGYQIEGLSIEDRYQDELGIDSIKKAEIIVTVLDELEINTGDNLDAVDFETIGDMVDYLKHAEEAPAEAPLDTRESAFVRMVERWRPQPLESIFMPRSVKAPLMIALEDVLRDPMRTLDVLRQRDQADWNLALLASADTFATAPLLDDRFEKSLKQSVYPLINFIRGLLDADIAPAILFLVARGQPHPFIRALNGLLKSVRKETASTHYKSLQVDSALSDCELEDLLQREHIAPDVDIRYVGRRREVLRLLPAPLLSTPKESAGLAEDAVVVALGGAKGITYSLMKHLSGRTKNALHLAGRSAASEPEVQKHMAELGKVNPVVTYTQLDATDETALMTFLDSVQERHGRIDVLINGAGTLSIDRLQDKTKAAIDHEFLNKVLPAWNSLRAAKQCGARRVVQFSSVLARYGGVGQSIYSAANALIDSLTYDYNVASGDTISAISINWPPWDEMGMTANPGVLTKLKAFGLALLTPKDANRFFADEIFGKHTENVFHFDRADGPVYAAISAEAERGRRLLGRPKANVSKSTIAFEKTFSLDDDAYLSEHIVMGVPCVPAATAIAMFYGAARQHLDCVPVLENIRARNPILVGDRVKTTLVSEANASGLSLALRSTILHFLAEAREAETVDVSKGFVAKAGGRSLSTPLYSEKRSGVDRVFHGQRFQTVEHAVVHEAGYLVAEIDDRGLADIFGHHAYSRLALWIDSAFQALGYLAFECHGLTVLPSKVGRLAVPSCTPSDKLTIQAKIGAMDQACVSGDAVVLNAQNEPVLSMTAMSMATIGPSPTRTQMATEGLSLMEA